ncbi:hypothetical protein KDA14_05140 [Candidatus Saccharibacteria bacterium]|nr:hypothetical protein [Candidatus Saccharibacteria bacterium]
MSKTVLSLLESAATTLQDVSYRRWSLAELFSYLNDGLAELAKHRVDAVSEEAFIPLVEGPSQQVDVVGSRPVYEVLDVLCNVVAPTVVVDTVSLNLTRVACVPAIDEMFSTYKGGGVGPI